jgi:hypothetical protein
MSTDVTLILLSLPTAFIDWIGEFFKWLMENILGLKEKFIDNLEEVQEKIFQFRIIPEFTILGVNVSMGQLLQFLMFYVCFTRMCLKWYDLILISIFYFLFI